MPIFLGIDSSTQSLTALLIDTDSGTLLHEESVNFGEEFPEYGQPSGFLPDMPDGEVHSSPLMWLDALDLALARTKEAGVDLSRVVAVAGSGQQHGSVYLDGEFGATLAGLDAGQSLSAQIAPRLTRETAPIWMDTSTSAECAEIAEAVGGDAEVCAKSGSIVIERFTGPQIRRFAKRDPEAWARTGVVHLVSSFMASVLAGTNAAIDHGDGAGMNLMNLEALAWDIDLLEATAPDLDEKLPPVAASGTVAGAVAPYFVEKYGFASSCEVVLFSGDNPCSLVGMGAATPGKVVISLGTSDTMFAAMPEPRTDPNGYGHVFGNPMGGFMSLICFINGSLAREAVKDEFGLSWDDFGPEGLAKTVPGNGGKVMVPFFAPEITPRVDSEGPAYAGWDGERDAASTVRAVLEGQFTNMKLRSQWLGVAPESILLTGGASQNDGVAQVVADVFGTPVSRLAVTGSAGLGAAMRAAAATGVGLTALEEAFCRPVEGSTIQPNAECGGVYDEFAQKFAAHLQDNYGPART